MALRLTNRVPAAAGATWVRKGWAVFGRRPLAFCGLFIVFLLAAGVLLALPLVGELAMAALMPLLTLAFMLSTKATLDGGGPGPKSLVEPLRAPAPRRNALLLLGLLYAALTALTLWLSDQVGGDSMTALREAMSAQPPDQARMDAALADPRLASRMLVFFGLASLISVPFWHAPALVYWGGQGVAQALFSSTLAVLRCLGAFSVYMAVWGVLLTGSMLVIGLALGILGAQSLMTGIAMPMALVFSAAFYASLYFTFRDSFTED